MVRLPFYELLKRQSLETMIRFRLTNCVILKKN